MQQVIVLNDTRVEYTVRNRKTRSVRLAVARGGVVTVTAPRLFPLWLIEKFIIRKSAWLLSKIDHFKQYKPALSRENQRAEFLAHKERARALVESRVEKWNEFYQFTFNKITIKKQRARWGSCSEKGNLNFNYKIVFLPDYLVDYIVVHELCHLGEMNHSKDFWALVARTLPEYRRLRTELSRLHTV